MKVYIICYGTPSPRAVIVGLCITPPVVGEVVEVRGARMILYWSAACGGLLGLCAHGPREGTRLTAAVPVYSVTCAEWGELTPEAAEGVASWPAV